MPEKTCQRSPPIKDTQHLNRAARYTGDMKITLSPIERQALKARAHPLSPLVIIGDNGLSASVIREIDRTLKAHELIKIRANTDDREQRIAWMAELCDALAAAPVQQIGKTLVIWRENPEKVKERAKASRPPQKPRERRLTKHQEEMRATGQMKAKAQTKPRSKAR
jgi:putative YhbY family RNA-binding protein